MSSRTSCTLVLAALLGAVVPAQLPPLPVPPQNPITVSKVNLGKTLFWDEQISSSGTVACATCHLPEVGGSDPRSVSAVHPGLDGAFGTADDVHGSPGVIAQTAGGTYRKVQPFPLVAQVTGRKAPSAIMAAYEDEQFWDGRATGRFDDPITGQTLIPTGASLETQASGPPISDVEMAHQGETWAGVAARIAAARPLALATNVPPALASWLAQRSYPQLFQEAFGSASVTPAAIVMAIATYERTLIADQAPIDAYLAGNPGALTPQEQQGFVVFGTFCARCHQTPLFRQPKTQYFNTGVRPIAEDPGRSVVTGQPTDDGRFKLAGLRNVGLRAPYFHNGGMADLGQVVDFYARGGDFHVNQTGLIRPFTISAQERAALLAFLGNPLTDPRVAQGLPPFDHPTLYTQSARAPQGYGAGGPGSGGLTPRLFAVDPPVLGNPRFALGLDDGLGGAPAALLLDAAAGSGTILFGVPIQLGLTPLLAAVDLGRLGDVGAGEGWSSLALAVPNDSQLAGASLYLQAFSVDAGAPQGVSATGGLQVTFFAPF